jgi:hypothetical protein
MKVTFNAFFCLLMLFASLKNGRYNLLGGGGYKKAKKTLTRE